MPKLQLKEATTKQELFWLLLEEYVYGVENALPVLSDFLEDNGEEAWFIRHGYHYTELYDLYQDRLYPDTINMTDEQFVRLVRETQDRDKLVCMRRNASKFQKNIWWHLQGESRAKAMGIVGQFLRDLPPSDWLLTGRLSKRDESDFAKKARLLRLLGYVAEAQRIESNLRYKKRLLES